MSENSIVSAPQALDCTRYTVRMCDGVWYVIKFVDDADGTVYWYYHHSEFGVVALAFGWSADGNAGLEISDEEAVTQIVSEHFDNYREEYMY